MAHKRFKGGCKMKILQPPLFIGMFCYAYSFGLCRTIGGIEDGQEPNASL